ncbi:MAG: (d)CMP kinase [Limnochordales bacterium]|nr:(d)CMP kinase [Limnochordales bacterium]
MAEGSQWTIAVDGPAGAGKSTIARRLAKVLRYRYLDTGAMYRAVTWRALTQGIDPARADPGELVEVARFARIDLEAAREGADCTALDRGRVFLDGNDVTDAIRSPVVSEKVSLVARVPGVREVLASRQRELAASGGIVVDGRDIGTVVLPDADLKIYVTASLHERARRRWTELRDRGFDVNLAELEEQIRRRDEIDSSREVAPLRRAADAIVIDTTGISVEAAIERVMLECKRRGLPCYIGSPGSC